MFELSSVVQRCTRLSGMALLGLGLASAQMQNAPGRTSVGLSVRTSDLGVKLRQGKLTVWASGRPSSLDWAAIKSALTENFPALQVTFRAIDPRSFVEEVHQSQLQSNLPDVIFIDNWMQAEPAIAQQQVEELVGRPRFYSHGWWFVMKQGAHSEAASSFLLWLEDDPKWQAPAMSTVGMTEPDKSLALWAAAGAVTGLPAGTKGNPAMDPEAARFDAEWGTGCGSFAEIGQPRVRFLTGNGRIAVATLTSDARTAHGKVACSGLLHSFTVLRKVGEGWKVLLLMPSVSLAQAVSLADNFERLNLSVARGTTAEAPSLISPYDGEPQTRFPKQDISWKQAASPPASYAVESRAGVVKNGEVTYGASILTFVNPGQYGSIVRMPAPFGVGMQPHRWRVWAIGKDGTVALSEWRTVQFTN